jgi:hypothetical protein
MGDLFTNKAMSKQIPITSDYVFKQAVEIGEVLQRAVTHALLTHKRLGNPIGIWQDDRVVIVPPGEIEIPPDERKTND